MQFSRLFLVVLSCITLVYALPVAEIEGPPFLGLQGIRCTNRHHIANSPEAANCGSRRDVEFAPDDCF